MIRFWFCSDRSDCIRVEWASGGALGRYTPGVDGFIRWESTSVAMDEVPEDVNAVAIAAMRRDLADGDACSMREFAGDETASEMFAAWCAVSDALEAA